MANLEERIDHVWHLEARTLMAEASRCYSTGSPRAAIVLTWSAVCADLIRKLYQLAEDGDGQAAVVTRTIDGAASKGDGEAIKAMQAVESGLLQTALNLELIDFTEKEQLERLQRDRNLCAHPSLRPLNEPFVPTLDYARAHLTAALEALLIHPPSQGRKVLDRFRAHVVDPQFVASTPFLTQTFFDRVKPATRRGIAELAAKHAVLELPVEDLDAAQIADRMATCLKAFAGRDRTVVREAVKKAVSRLAEQLAAVQLRALVRLGGLDVFRDSLDAGIWHHCDALIQAMPLPEPGKWLDRETVGVVGLVQVSELRSALPSLEGKFAQLSPRQKWFQLVIHSPDSYHAGFLAEVVRGLELPDAPQTAGSTVELYLDVLDDDQLEGVLGAWAENNAFRTGVGQEALKSLFVKHMAGREALGPSPAWSAFVRKDLKLKGADSPWRYNELAALIETAQQKAEP